MRDFGFLYYRDKDTGEYKLLGKANSLAVYGIRNDEATTIRDRPSKIIEIDSTAREMGERRMSLNVPFSAIRKICKHYSVSCDRYGDGKWVDACHHPKATSSGDSWGKCSRDTCPIYEERRKNNMCEKCVYAEKVLVSDSPTKVGIVAYKCKKKSGLYPYVTMCMDFQPVDADGGDIEE